MSATATDYDPIIELPPDLQIAEGPAIQSRETWHLPRDKWRKIREQSAGAGVKVAVLDTGYHQHPTLPKALAERSFIRGQSVADGNGHGTHCAGTVLSRDEDIGVAPQAELIVGKVLSNGGSGSSSGIAAGVNWAIDAGADIISMSLGGGSRYEPTVTAIKRAFSKGIIVCCAAGNSGFNGRRNTIGYPARSGESICVGALNSSYRPAGFSSGGSQMVIAAPGQNILSCSHRGSGFVTMSGTSMATPMVAGEFALIVSMMRAQGQASWNSVQAVNEFVKANATDLLADGHDPATGFGVYDMLGVLTKMANGDQLKFA